ncbi:MAG: SelB C-terminal domain-containing protein, partial [Chloroflexi bacterium]|nr:SelB C-terminal domain-containing protein [Chloroflexota bacterium]
LKHSSEVKVFVGTSETIATVRLLGTEELSPGEVGWIQLELRGPIVAVRGDHYILRRPSPGETLGGGVIVDPQPKGRHKRFNENVLKSLESLTQGSAADVLFEAALALNIAPIKDIIARSRLEAQRAEEALRELIESGKLIPLEEGLLNASSDGLATAAPHWIELNDKVLQIVGTYHKNFPLRRGIPREELKSRLKLTPRIFNAVLGSIVNRKSLIEIGAFVAAPSHKIKFDSGQQAKVKELMRKFAQSPFGPPTVKECQAEVGEEILNALIESNQLVSASADVVFRKQDYDSMTAKIRAAIEKNGQITLAEVRDMFNTSRKYAQALLEHLDAMGVTTRDGDVRRLRK